MLKEETEQNIQEYIDKFEEDFEMVLDDKIKPIMLIDLFNNYIEENSHPSKKYYYILNEMDKMKTMLLKTLSDEQKELFEKTFFLQQKLEYEQVLQFWVYGICTGNTIFNEIQNIIKDNER